MVSSVNSKLLIISDVFIYVYAFTLEQYFCVSPNKNKKNISEKYFLCYHLKFLESSVKCVNVVTSHVSQWEKCLH